MSLIDYNLKTESGSETLMGVYKAFLRGELTLDEYKGESERIIKENS